jgi:UPF0755 protein
MNNKKLFYVLSASVLLVLSLVFIAYKTLFGTSINTGDKSVVIYIPTGSSYNSVLDTLYSNLNIEKPKLLEWVAEKKNYPLLIKPGRYVIDSNISYIGLVNLLRSGRQKPVKITFNNARTLNQIAGKIGKYIEADSVQIMTFLSDESNYNKYGFKTDNIIALFIPDTYELYWNTDPKELFERMLNEYRKFWNAGRLSKAKEKNLEPVEVSILASIIDDEVVKVDEKPRIAGVYINRLERGIPLQACPTIKFALNDFTITRVLKKHLTIDSPYNTYKHKGFPPGPIGCPSKSGLDAVLNAEKHDYLFFAAKADFSGYHNFSRTLSEHNRYAALYQSELNKRKIFK